MSPSDRSSGESGFVRHGEIVAHLRRQIVGGQLGPGAQLPTQIALQKQFGTTPVTVQRAFNRLTAEGFIGVASNRGTFVSEHPPHLWRYGIVFPDRPTEHAPFRWSRFYTTLEAIAREVSNTGPRRIEVYYNINGHIDSEDFPRLVRDVKSNTLAGLMFPFSAVPMNWLPGLENSRLPMVAIGSGATSTPMSGLSENFLDRGLAWLRDQGRHDVGVITMPTMPQEMFSRAIEKAGLSTRPFWTQAVQPQHTSWVRHAVHAILHSDPNRIPNGLVVTDDHLVEAVADALVGFGVRVPDDVMVVGYWNFPYVYSRQVEVQLLGMDNTELIRRWVSAIDILGRGDPMPKRGVMEPVFGGRDKISGIPAIHDLPPPVGKASARSGAKRRRRGQTVS